METGLLRDFLTGVVGVITGALSGALGVGGAAISTPGIRLLGVAPLVAVGTTLPAILPSAVSGGLRYRAEGLVDGRAVAWAAPAGVVASVAGAVAAGLVPGEGHLLQIFTAVLLGASAWRVATGLRRPGTRPAARAPAGAGRPPAPAALSAVGAVAGALSGLLGIGGGIVLVPAFTMVGLSVRVSIATSLVCVGVLAVPGTLAHAVLGNIDWRVALVLAVAVVPGARLGAAASLRLRDRRLTQVVAVVLGVIAVVYGGAELAVLSRG